jgi:hypothetical protein
MYYNMSKRGGGYLMGNNVVTLQPPKGKKTGAWIIKGANPPSATNGIEVFSAKDSSKKTAHA